MRPSEHERQRARVAELAAPDDPPVGGVARASSPSRPDVDQALRRSA